MPGEKGAAGAAGTIANVTVIDGPAVVSAPAPAVGTGLQGTATCPQGSVMTSGGGVISTSGSDDRNISLTASYPLNSKTWRTVAVVNSATVPGVTFTLKPFAVCGTP